MPYLKEEFERRLADFRDAYAFSEPDEVVRALTVTGELLDLVFGGLEAPLAMTALRKLIAHGAGREWDWASLSTAEVDFDWRETWAEFDGWDESSSPAMLDELHELSAFGRYGIAPIWSLAGDRQLELPQAEHLRRRLSAVQDMPEWVESVCRKIDRLERLAPRNESGRTALTETLTTRDLARSRIKFDEGRPLTIHELALLSGVSSKRLQNAIYAKTEGAPLVDRNGLVSAGSCEPWLAGRDYLPSIWKHVAKLYPLSSDWGESIELEAGEPDRVMEDYVFVPVASDGSIFSPSLVRSTKLNDGYAIGPKGAERVVRNYEDALQQLLKMETPRWRRPNPESGNWGIVAGQTWKRVRSAELEAL